MMNEILLLALFLFSAVLFISGTALVVDSGRRLLQKYR
jgi:hypothetical protein